MKTVAKYNIFKGVSTLLTIGTPIVTLLLCGDFFIHRSDTAISVAGVFAILISLLFCKDKLAEHWKMPSAFVLSTILCVLTFVIESIIIPIKYVCICTMLTTGIDELSFKRLYKHIEAQLPEQATAYMHIGFLFTTTKHLLSVTKET